MTSSDLAFLRKLAEIKRSGNFRMSMEQLRRLDTIKQAGEYHQYKWKNYESKTGILCRKK